MSLYSNLRHIAVQQPDAPALVGFDGAVTSYSRLLETVDTIAESLDMAAYSGRVFGLAVDDPLGFVATYFAAADRDLVIVLLDGRSIPTDLERSTAKFDVDFLLRDGDTGSGSIRVEEVGAEGRRAHAYHSSDFVVHCTSGSTGEPKGIVMTQAAVAARVQSWRHESALRPTDVVLCALPLWHGHGIDVLTLPTLLSGATVVFTRGSHLTARGLARAIHDHAVTIVSGLPVMYQMLVGAQGVGASMLSSLRLALTGSAPISADTQARFIERFDLPLRQGYGLGEIGIIAWDADYAGPGMIGLPLPDIEIRLEPDECDSTPAFELLVRGPSLARGYYRDPDAEQATFADGWLRTHDLVGVEPRGWSVRGRKSTFINVTGNKVAPIEVENALRACEGVADCAVVGVDDGTGGEQVAALIVADGPREAEAIRRRVARQLRPYQLPQLYLFADAVPRTAVGKTDYKTVRRVVGGSRADRDFISGSPADIAVEWGDHRLTYADLENTVAALAHRLTALVPPRAGVLVMGPLCPAYLVGLLAAWRVGAVPVPVDAGSTADRYSWLEQRMAPAVVISTDVTTVDQYIGAAPGAVEIVIESGTGAIVVDSALEPAKAARTFTDPDASYVIPTSGSTGEPKAIVGSQRGLRDFLMWFGKEFGLTHTDRCAALTRVNFDPSLRELLGVLGVGGTLALPPVDAQSDLSSLADHLIDTRPTVVFLVPSVATRLAAEPRLARTVLTGLRLIFCAGEVLSRRVVQQLSTLAPNAEIVNLYGQTEATLAQLYRRNAQDSQHQPVPVGVPRPGIEVAVADDGSGVGEVFLTVESPALGLLGAESSGPHRIVSIPNPLPTGDLGYLTDDGELVVVGRVGNDIKYGGRRISFHQFVDAVEDLQDALQCVVDDQDGPQVFVAIDRADDDNDLHDTIHALGRRFGLPRFALHLLSALPVLRNGKVDRRALLASLRHNVTQTPLTETTTTTHSRPEIEQQLCAMLRLDDVDTSFVEAGVTSLDMLDIVARINRAYGIRLTAHVGFGLRNTRGLADEIYLRRSDCATTPVERTVEVEAEPTNDYPLATRQVAYMRICMARGNANWCNLSREIRFSQPLTGESIEGALRMLFERHDVLGLALDDNWQRQTYTPAANLMASVGVIDLAAKTSTSEFHDGVESARATLVAELIDPTSPPPLRVVLVRGTDGCSAIVAAHHLFVDGPGMDVLAADLHAAVSGGPRNTVTGSGSYRAYCLATARSDRRGAAAAYWQHLLAGVDQIHLPESEDRDGASGELLSLPFGVLHTRGIHRVAKALGVSAFTVVLAAFEAAVGTAFGIEQVPIIVASQHRAGLDSSVVGMFTGTLVVRGTGSAAFPEAVTALADQLAAGTDHGDWEFDQRIADLDLPATDDFPLSTVLFNQRPVPRGGRIRDLGSWRPRSLGRSLRYQLQGELQMSGPDMVMTYYYRRGIGGAEIIHNVHRILLRVIDAGQETIHV
ncbi:AMP-binding protein [Nocardia salmonicida]|uniref:AMP-binding protein n=1 Tax=Nocardia salmonicida TaxID=53431 RepID=UPI0007A50F52|nr:AMP-binding protein [Nocardia salmonicida]